MFGSETSQKLWEVNITYALRGPQPSILALDGLRGIRNQHDGIVRFINETLLRGFTITVK